MNNQQRAAAQRIATQVNTGTAELRQQLAEMQAWLDKHGNRTGPDIPYAPTSPEYAILAALHGGEKLIRFENADFIGTGATLSPSLLRVDLAVADRLIAAHHVVLLRRIDTATIYTLPEHAPVTEMQKSKPAPDGKLPDYVVEIIGLGRR